jgi:hypothetical protein
MAGPVIAVLHVVAEEEVQGCRRWGQEEQEQSVVNGHVCVTGSADDCVQHGRSIERPVN